MDLIEELVERNKKDLADIYGRSYKKVHTNSQKSVLKKRKGYSKKKVYTKKKGVHLLSKVSSIVT